MEKIVPPIPVPPIMVQVSKTVVDLRTPEFNQVFQDSGQTIIDFSSMHINEVYAVHSTVKIEIKP